MKFIIASALIFVANADDAARIFSRHQNFQDKKTDAEHRGGKLRATRLLTEDLCLSMAPLVPAEMSLGQSMPEDAEVKEVEADADVGALGSKGAKRKQRARLLTEDLCLSMTAPLMPAEMSLSLSMPVEAMIEEVKADADATEEVTEEVGAFGSKGAKRKQRARLLTEDQSLSMAPLVPAEMNLSMPVEAMINEVEAVADVTEEVTEEVGAFGSKGRKQRARLLTEDQSLSMAPLVPAEMSLSMPVEAMIKEVEAVADATEEVKEEVTEEVGAFGSKGRKQRARLLTEDQSLSMAPLVPAEMSLSLSMPVGVVAAEVEADAEAAATAEALKVEVEEVGAFFGSKGAKRKQRARLLMEVQSMSMSATFDVPAGDNATTSSKAMPEAPTSMATPEAKSQKLRARRA